MQTQVSCRNIGWAFDVCARYQIPLNDVFSDLDHSERHYRDTSKFISWEEFRKFVEHITSQLNEKQIVDFSVASLRASFFKIYATLSRVFSDPAHFYQRIYGNQGLLQSFYPLTSHCEITGENQVHIELRLNDGLTPCPSFFTVMKGQMIGITKVMSLDYAAVTMSDQPSGANFDVILPRSQSVFKGLWVRIRKPLDLIHAARYLDSMQHDLVSKNHQLKQFEAREEQSRTILDQQSFVLAHMQEVIWQADLDLRITYMSPSIAELSGWPTKVLISTQYEPLLTDHYVNQMNETFAVAIDTQQKQIVSEPSMRHCFRSKLQHQQGHLVDVEVKIQLILDKDGVPQNLLGTCCNLSSQLKQETQQDRLQQRLRHAEKLETIGQMAGGLAREFSDLILTITGNAQLARHCDQAQHHGHLANIQQASKKASSLVRQLLASSRRQILEPVCIDLNDALETLQESAQARIAHHLAKQQTQGNYSLVFKPSKLSLNTEVDLSQLERILHRLVDNAVDAMPTGGEIILSTEKHRFCDGNVDFDINARSGNFCGFHLTDRGRGIKSDDLPHVFEPFYSSSQYQREGLGLCVVQGIALQHDGFVKIRSTVNEGTTISVYFPASVQTEQDELLVASKVIQ